MGDGLYLKVFSECLFGFVVYVYGVVSGLVIVFFLDINMDDIFIGKDFICNLGYLIFIIFLEDDDICNI